MYIFVIICKALKYYNQNIAFFKISESQQHSRYESKRAEWFVVYLSEFIRKYFSMYA